MPLTITLTDVTSRGFCFTQPRGGGSWVLHFEYALVDAQGKTHGGGELDFTPGANAQTQLSNIFNQALQAARNKEGL